MEQLDLLGDPPPSRDVAVPLAGGWIGRRDELGRIVEWTHPHYQGTSIRHCGHPTALYPYYVLSTHPRLASSATYRNLSQAQAVILSTLNKGAAA